MTGIPPRVAKLDSSRSAIVVAFGALALASLWPLFVFSDLPLQDVPNHLARAYILLHPADPVLLKNYRIEWSVIPDLGWDLWALTFGAILAPTAAAKLLVVTSFVLGLGGSLALGYALTGRWSLVPLIASPFLLNGAYAKGFLSFDLGLVVSLWASAWWAWVDETRWVLRLAGATLFATALYIIHFYSFAIYGLFVLGFEIQRIVSAPPEERTARSLNLFRDGLQSVPALLLVLNTVRGAAATNIGLEREPFVRFGNLALLIDCGRPYVDAALVMTLAALIALAIAKGWLSQTKSTGAVLLLCLLAFLVLPDGVINTTYIAWRVMLLFVFAGIASLQSTTRTPRSLVPCLIIVAFSICISVTAIDSASWRQSAVEKEAFLSTIAPLSDGARIFFAHAGTDEKDMVRTADGAYHVDAFAVPAKRALVQPMFVYPGQQVLRYRDPVIQATPGNSETFLTTIDLKFRRAHLDFRSYLKHFDFVVLHGSDHALEARMFPVDRWRLVRRVANYRLYRLP